MTRVVLSHERMIPAGFLDHSFIERDRVVRAHEPEVGIGKGEVQERLVTLALGHLVGAPARPDRLADPANRPIVDRVGGEEVLPGRDDPGRVHADFTHVREQDVFGITAELAREAPIFSALSTTRIGSSAATDARANSSVPSMNSSASA